MTPVGAPLLIQERGEQPANRAIGRLRYRLDGQARARRVGIPPLRPGAADGRPAPTGAIVAAECAGWVMDGLPHHTPHGLCAGGGVLPGRFPATASAARPQIRQGPAGGGAFLDGETQTRTGDTTIFSHPCGGAASGVFLGVWAGMSWAAPPAASWATWSDGNPRPENAAAASSSWLSASRCA